MKYTTKAKKIGSSLFLIIPNIIKNNFEINENDDIEINIKKINEENLLKEYRCKLCNLIFTTDDEQSYCPSCDCEDLELNIKEYK